MNNESRIMNINKGFILFYVSIIGGTIAIIISIFAATALNETKISRDEAESLKAFYAADSGIECVKYYQNNNYAFNPTTPEASYSCGIGSGFIAGFNPPAAQCVDHTYNFTIGNFSNGSCAEIEVTVTPRTIYVGGNPIIVCSVSVVSNGKNSCNATKPYLVERTRWEDL